MKSGVTLYFYHPLTSGGLASPPTEKGIQPEK